MAFPAGIREGVASKAGPLIQHRQLGMSPILELPQREMRAGGLVVASVTEIGHVARRAGSPIEGRVLSMNVVLPAARV